MSTFREKHLASGVLADLVEPAGEGYCRYKDPDMTDSKAADVINAKLAGQIGEPFAGENIRYIRVELFGKLYDQDGGRARPQTVELDVAEAIRRTRDEVFGEIGLVRTMSIMLARELRDTLRRLGEEPSETVTSIADTPTWKERDR